VTSEFSQADSSVPDAAELGHDTSGGGWGNNELQNHTTRTNNARILGGHLVSEPRYCWRCFTPSLDQHSSVLPCLAVLRVNSSFVVVIKILGRG